MWDSTALDSSSFDQTFQEPTLPLHQPQLCLHTTKLNQQRVTWQKLLRHCLLCRLQESNNLSQWGELIYSLTVTMRHRAGCCIDRQSEATSGLIKRETSVPPWLIQTWLNQSLYKLNNCFFQPITSCLRASDQIGKELDAVSVYLNPYLDLGSKSDNE